MATPTEQMRAYMKAVGYGPDASHLRMTQRCRTGILPPLLNICFVDI